MTAAPRKGEAVPEATAGLPRGGPARSCFSKVVVGLGALGTVGIFLLMVLINADVLGRAVFDRPLPGVPEIVQMAVVAIVFLQVSQALAGGRFTRSPVVHSAIVARAPRLGRALGALFNLTGAVLMGMILTGEVPRLWEAIVQHEYFGHRGVFVAPRWPVDLTVVVGCAICAVQFLLMAWDDLLGKKTDAVDSL